MKTTQTYARFVEWLSADDMHRDTKEWLSHLQFIKDEHSFFEDLVTSNTLQLIKPEKFVHNKEIIDAINRSQKQNRLLIDDVRVHKNKLQIMVDGIDQPKEEEAYKNDHRLLVAKINAFLKYYTALKLQLFDIVKNIKKEEKDIILLDRK
ncbi:hypothetical protein [uncultured Winogradskyella sp.]|uniref:hypothetical protein n=1 Tax=uncultured Winogradskyella sp. TaxID=395353 RepID=UPI002332BC45|nr:hypothetical protein [Winogradskyella sp.]MDC1504324.1 hypothetical protein [Winogradskyella sp.]|tara:strand:+ start:105870 stop:106319 length:450 start_codon:yes stop_codon:yes gene_type:complete